MRILTHIQNQLVELQCGQGRQRIIWLADSALHRVDEKYGLSLGAVAHVKLADGTILNSNSAISDTLTDAAEVWVVLKDELGDSVRGEESKTGQKTSARSARSTSRSKK